MRQDRALSGPLPQPALEPREAEVGRDGERAGVSAPAQIFGA